MPTGKVANNKKELQNTDNDIRSDDDDGLQRMDQEKLRLIWQRMQAFSVKRLGEKISREDFLDRIFLEEEVKDFYDLLQEPIMEDFKAF